jgi:hypothetical protein
VLALFDLTLGWFLCWLIENIWYAGHGTGERIQLRLSGFNA